MEYVNGLKYSVEELYTSFGKENVSLTLFSIIIIKDNKVYKLKRSLLTPYVDTSLHSYRNYLITKEFKINKSISPDIYLGVGFLARDINQNKLILLEPKTKISPSKLDIIEKVVIMKKLDKKFLLSEKLEKRIFTKRDINILANHIFKLHDQLFNKVHKVSSYGKYKVVKYNLEETLLEIKNIIFNYKLENEIPEFNKTTDRLLLILDKSREIINSRARPEYICGLHGDMRPEQIFIYPDSVFFLDAVESVPRFYNCDYISDLSFLGMSLDYYNYPEFDTELLNTYESLTHKIINRRLYLYYKTYRALIRMKIGLYKYTLQEEDKEINLETTKKLYDLAVKYITMLE